MPEKQTSEVGCTSHNWIKANYLIWYRVTVYHNNVPSVVKDFCGDECRFPSCVSAALRTDETASGIALLPDGDGAAQKRAIARAHVNGLLPDPSKLENRIEQQRLWLSDESEEGGK